MVMRITATLIVCLGIGLVLSGCSRAYMSAAEALGYEKREQLTDRVEDARDEQLEAREQFESALEEFRALTGPIDEDLEEIYDRLRRQLKRSESRASGVSSKIDKVETVADALFKEWRKELDEYQTDALRAASEDQLERTEARYGQLLGAMRNAESRMEPVLAAFSDQVLFLKHNLNARAIASLQENVVDLEQEIGALIAEMNASIDEANAFIEEMGES